MSFNRPVTKGLYSAIWTPTIIRRLTKKLAEQGKDLATPISSQLIAGIVDGLNLNHDYMLKKLKFHHFYKLRAKCYA